MRLLSMAAVTMALAVPTKAPADNCASRRCKARVAHRQCDQQHPRTCVLHVIYHQGITGWRRAWLLRVPGCESRWDPYAVSPGGHSGTFQFAPSTWASTPYGRRWIFSARWQAYAAAWMLKVGRAPAEWSCR